jgi:hypothetical protein
MEWLDKYIPEESPEPLIKTEEQDRSTTNLCNEKKARTPITATSVDGEQDEKKSELCSAATATAEEAETHLADEKPLFSKSPGEMNAGIRRLMAEDQAVNGSIPKAGPDDVFVG